MPRTPHLALALRAGPWRGGEGGRLRGLLNTLAHPVRGREVLREDLATMESNFHSIASGALPHIILSQQELLIQNHYRAADDLLKA